MFVILLELNACTGQPALPDVLPSAPPTSTPRVISPTGTIVWPSITTTVVTPPIITPSPVGTVLPITGTPAVSLTMTAASTPSLPLNVMISGCNTSMDITHSMGEVTNAYVTIRNSSAQAMIFVCATLSASDEHRTHPDKTMCIDWLPAWHQVILKLTVDTGFQQDTTIHVDVNTDQGIILSTDEPSCTDIGLPGWIPARVGIVEPIP